MFKIVTTPNAILHQKTQPVKKFDKKLNQTIEEMKETLAATHDPVGVGLAAPQVGISKQIFIARPNQKSKARVFINPKIINQSTREHVTQKESEKPDKSRMSKKNKKRTKKARLPDGQGKSILEGCLSMPTIWGKVRRDNVVELRYQDGEGEKHEETFEGFMAVIIQHEVDHLNGTLFTKHSVAQGQQLYKSSRNEKGEEEFEEIEL